MKRAAIIVLVLATLATGTYTFWGPLSDMSGSWTTARLTHTSTDADGFIQLDTLNDLTTYIAGTTNQVIVTDDTDGSVTLSLPQDIHTGASPTFDDLTLTDDLTVGDLATINGELEMANNPVDNVGYIDFELTPDDGHAEGRLHWDANDATLEVGMPGGDVKVQLGQENVIRARNSSGSQIANGTVVYISGGSGANAVISVADPDIPASPIGLATEDIDNNQFGYVTTFGLVRDVNTAAFSAGDVIYLGEDGALATARPTPPKYSRIVGQCTRSHATEGVVYCTIGPFPRLQALSDTLTTSITDKDIMQWDGTDSRFENTNDPCFATLFVGDDANFIEIESDGSLEMHGDATVWDDMRVSISNVRVPAASAPTWTAYQNSQVLGFSKSADEIIFFETQLPHSYKQGSDIDFHIHTAYADSDPCTVRWNFTYSWANINSDFPAATTVSAEFESPEDADKHVLEEIASGLDGSGKNISSVLLCSLEREGTDPNDDYDDTVYLVSLDFHFELDTIGSRGETSK